MVNMSFYFILPITHKGSCSILTCIYADYTVQMSEKVHPKGLIHLCHILCIETQSWCTVDKKAGFDVREGAKGIRRTLSNIKTSQKMAQGFLPALLAASCGKSCLGVTSAWSK